VASGQYGKTFYMNASCISVNSANTILPIIFKYLPKISSVVDFGCAEGVWLSEIIKMGIDDIKGLDGSWVDKARLKIPVSFFKEADFEQNIILDRKYDLAISLEVAEHLKKEAAKTFIKSITDTADFVLFSAAIPFQGGTSHINEQWPEYWNNIFNEYGFVANDFLRNAIWDLDVSIYYKQNAILFLKKNRINDTKLPENTYCINNPPVRVIHPKVKLQRVVTRIFGNGILLNAMVNCKNRISYKKKK
jgi:hypothetical protein